MLTEWLIFPLAVRSRGHSFVATCGFSLAAGSRGYFSLRWLLSLQSMGSRRTGLVAPCHVEPSRTGHQTRVPAAWAGRFFSTGQGGPAECFFRSRRAGRAGADVCGQHLSAGRPGVSLCRGLAWASSWGHWAQSQKSGCDQKQPLVPSFKTDSLSLLSHSIGQRKL